MKLKEKIFNQVNVGMAWGGFKALLSSASSYASWISLAIQITVFYTVVLPYVKDVIDLPFWLFMLIVVIVGVLVLLFEWKVTIPSSLKFSNKQSYIHDNPIRKDIADLQKDIDLIKEKLNINN